MSLSVTEYLGHIHKEAGFLMRRLANVRPEEFKRTRHYSVPAFAAWKSSEKQRSECPTTFALNINKWIGAEWQGCVIV